MAILQAIGLIIFSLSILVTVHELGHFWAARIFGMRVEVFSLFFGPKLFGVKWGDTEWRVSLIPLGGYVKISGMLDESMDKEQLEKEPQPWEFRSKPRWQRLIVMLGGIIMNIVLGMILFVFIKLGYGDDHIPIDNVKNGIVVMEGSPIHSIGFRTGDKIVSYQNQPIKYFDEASDPSLLVDRDKVFGVDRAGQKLSIEMPNSFIAEYQEKMKGSPLFEADVPPRVYVIDTSYQIVKDGKIVPHAWQAGLRDSDLVLAVNAIETKLWSDLMREVTKAKNSVAEVVVNRAGVLKSFQVQIDTAGKMYVSKMTDPNFMQHVDLSFGEALVEGPKEGMLTLKRQVKGLVMLGSGNVNVRENLSGPVRIAQVMQKGYSKEGWAWVWRLTAMLSMVLAIMNLLPIPVLDGGHVVFLLIEMAIRRDIPMRVKEIAMQIGFVLIIALMAFILLNDSIQLFK